MWSVGEAGDERLMPNMKGLHYLRALLQRPGAELTALNAQLKQSGLAPIVVKAPTEKIEHEGPDDF